MTQDQIELRLCILDMCLALLVFGSIGFMLELYL
jgi:hypothetical protein